MAAVDLVLRTSGRNTNYRPADGPHCCGNCGMWKNGACDLVLPPTEADHVCDRWIPGQGDER